MHSKKIWVLLEKDKNLFSHCPLMYIQRTLYPILQNYLEKKKVIILYGARQVGKTTLAKELFKNQKYLYLNGDEYTTRQMLWDFSKIGLEKIVTGWDCILFDEAQKMKDIGTLLKIIHENFPEKKLIATWSSSFELANRINEPLTWRKYEFTLYPFSIEEISQNYNFIELSSKIDDCLITGMYPEIIVDYDSQSLKNLVNSYVYKDVLTFEKIKKSDELIKLLQLLAFQIGSEVSYYELWQQCGLNSKTVEQYIQILEQAFIIFRLSSYTYNQRNAIKKKKKIYFWDLWVRNMLINNLNPVNLRNDLGGIWENFVIVEMIKKMHNHLENVSFYFWKDQKAELDFIVSMNGELKGYEIKYTRNKGKNYQYIKNTLNLASLEIINKANVWDFIR